MDGTPLMSMASASDSEIKIVLDKIYEEEKLTDCTIIPGPMIYHAKFRKIIGHLLR